VRERTSDEIQRELAASFKHSDDLRADVTALAQTAAEIRREATRFRSKSTKAMKQAKAN
jgi:hypothetical protein